MPKMRLSLRNPSVLGLEEFFYTADLWTGISGNETITRVTGANNLTGSTSPIMRIATTAADEGAYKDYTVEAGDLVWVTFKSLEATEATTIEAYDQTNGANIDSQAGSIDSAATIFFAFTVPKGCTTVRMKITTSAAKTVDVDDFAFSRNALIFNANQMLPSPEAVGGVAQVLSGDRVKYKVATHRQFTLNFSYVTDTMYDRLWELFQSSDTIYFDSGDVPTLTEDFTYYDTLTYNLLDHTSPVSDMTAGTVKGIAKQAAQSTIPTAYTGPVGAGATPLTEATTADYGAIGVDDGNSMNHSNPADGFYYFHKYVFNPIGWTRTDIQRLSITVKCESVDSSPAGLHGAVLYCYIWTALDTALGWTEIARTTNGDKNTIVWSTTDPNRAQSMHTQDQDVAPLTDYPDLFLLCRTRGQRDGTNALTLKTYYVEITWNEGLDSEMTLTHQIFLPTDTEADDITVRNKTSGATYTHGTNFTVRDGVTLPTNVVTFVSGPSQGDDIEAIYNRHHEVRIAYMPDRTLFDDVNSNPRRQLSVVLETIKGEG